MTGLANAQKLRKLRQRAEARLAKRESAEPPIDEADAKRLVHELRVHQLQLEMQNEELKAARYEIEAGLQRYTELFDFAPIGYFVVGGDGAISNLNLAGARLLGQARQRLIGRSFSACFDDEQQKSLGALLDRVYASDENSGSSSCELTLGEGKAAREVLLTAACIAGSPPAALCAVEDINPRKRAERALRQELKQRDVFLANLSHELRTPLTSITLSLDLLARSEPGGERANRAGQILNRQVAHMTTLVDDLLDVARISGDKIQLQKERIELNEAVRCAVEDQRPSFEKANVHLQFTPAAGAIHVHADRTRILQAVGNLLHNAVKFTRAGGATRVSVTADNGAVTIHVEDDGIGMTPDTLAQLFTPFKQGNPAADRTKSGLGLGLALVKSLVELHGGNVSARSSGLGRGSEFLIRIGRDETQPREPEFAGAPVTRTPRRILIIEDDADAACSLKEVLELREHGVAIAHDGLAGIARALSFKPDVILCDIGLPGIDGYEVARRLLAEASLGPVLLVAVSGYTQPEDRRRADAAGFETLVAKPPKLDDLEQLMNNWHP